MSEAWLEPIAEVLDRLGIQWALIGALAALRYRLRPRLTTDLDLLVASSVGVSSAFRDEGFHVREVSDPGEPPHLILVRGRDIVADLMVANVDYQRTALQRAVDHVITAEDVIVHKLIAWRPRDRDDVLSILRAQTSIDEEYVSYWANEWGVADHWEEARSSR